LQVLTNARDDDSSFRADFCAGKRGVLQALYHDHFETVDRAVGRVLNGPDRETVVQDVFCRLLASEDLRRNFQGGSLDAWLTIVARNQAIDYVRRYQREVPLDESDRFSQADTRFAERTEAKLLVTRFRREVLPAKWEPVFQARFIERLSQREAAAKLGMRRTTLVYQELRIHALLRRFFLDSPEQLEAPADVEE
jgi:RNA polymerase sigma-70 factor (ECF subfamily)